MKWKIELATAALSIFAFAGSAAAEGELNIYNWGDYTSPELIKKFEDAYKVKVTITDYDFERHGTRQGARRRSRLRHRRALGQLRADLGKGRHAARGAARPDGKLQECRRALGQCSLGSKVATTPFRGSGD